MDKKREGQGQAGTLEEVLGHSLVSPTSEPLPGWSLAAESRVFIVEPSVGHQANSLGSGSTSEGS